MVEAARHDAWDAGDAYEAYMGRWSRAVAPPFLDWLAAERGLDWLDVGCGTGALTAAIVAGCDPRSVVSVDLSPAFIDKARSSLSDPRVDFRTGSADALDLPDASRDVVVSGLVFNFLPDQGKALAEARRVTRSGGVIGFYVWDYPGHGLEFVNTFWKAAASLDPDARDLEQGRRFPFCTPDGLVALATQAGLGSVECRAIEVPTLFRDFDDYWHPFTLGAGPAPGYVASLPPEDRERLRDTLESQLAGSGTGPLAMSARAWGVRSRVP
jgi:SAM-dependent methyltransferase